MISESWTFGLQNLFVRTREPFFSNLRTFGLKNLRTHEPSNLRTFGLIGCNPKNRGWRFNIRSQWWIITMLCLDTFQVKSIALNFLLFWRPRYNDVLRSTLHRYDVASPPSLRHICSRPNSSALNYRHPWSSYYQRQCNIMFYVKCYVNTLSNRPNDKDLYFSRLL